MNALVKVEQHAVTEHVETSYDIMEKVIGQGDLGKLTAKERVEYYNAVCKSVGLNPLTRPFEFIRFDGKITLYARKDCTEQLRAKRKISIVKVEKEVIEGVYLFTAYAKAADGQEDVATGAVAIKGLSGKSLANAYKIAETQAKRRVTLSISGLGWTDESEVPDVPSAQVVHVDPQTGEIKEAEKLGAPPLTSAEKEKALNEIAHADNLNILKNVFGTLYRQYHDHETFMPELINAKDNKKLQLEEKAKHSTEEFRKEMFNEEELPFTINENENESEHEHEHEHEGHE